MKLLGVEFDNYACFEKQYVPLQHGVNLIAGRNNAGKSALLRGLAAVANLPDADASPLLAYKPKSAKCVGINVYFDANDEDNLLRVEGETSKLPNGYGPKRAVYRLAAVNGINKIVFRQVDLLLGNSILPVIDTNDNGLTWIDYIRGHNALPSVVRSRILIPGATKHKEGGDTWWGIPGQAAVFSGLTQFGGSSFVEPHRIVSDTVAFQTANDPHSTGSNLAQYLATLGLNQRNKFHNIEQFITSVFPEFTFVNTPTEGNSVGIRLTLSNSETSVPLRRLGNGVEQMLTLACLVQASSSGSLVLLDEPHLFLHPHAQRRLFEFLDRYRDRIVFASTHSAVLINCVSPERITHVTPPGKPFAPEHNFSADASRILEDIGYRNSDLLFEDRIVFGEGPTEREVLPILLSATKEVGATEIRATSFLELEGVPENVDSQQKKILRYEEILNGLGRDDIPRLYILDGDRSRADKNRLLQTGRRTSGEHAPVVFLPRTEIENYLLVPTAIASALRDEAAEAGVPFQTTSEEVFQRMESLLKADETNDPEKYLKVFPTGKPAGADPYVISKGSAVLELLYWDIGKFTYDKRKSGRRIARYLNLSEQPLLIELWELCRSVFPTSAVAAGAR
jgi:ABC-type transport system involved in cytochrome c biogenesis ATPase subunit